MTLTQLVEQGLHPAELHVTFILLLRFIFETGSVTMDYQAALDYTKNLLPLPPEYWDYKYESSYPELCIIY